MAISRVHRSFLAGVGLAMLLAGCTFVSEPVQTTATVEPSAAPELTETLAPILDSGETALATGEATFNEDGSVTYVVAEDDVARVICDRFGISWQQLQYEDMRQGVTCFASVFPGDVLNLSRERDGVVTE